MTDENKKDELTPLAERCRPTTLEDFLGQEHVIAPGRIINSAVATGKIFSLILWGGPGSGKTTLAKIIAESCSMEAHFLSAISSGVSDVRKVISIGKANRKDKIQTLLFLDEIHRFNKAQQDAVLGAVENGDIVLIGATTENPSFSIIAPLLSRTRVIRLNKLLEKSLLEILKSVLKRDEFLLKEDIKFGKGIQEKIVSLAGGDARRMLNIFETAYFVSENNFITEENVKEAVENSILYYDRAGDRHYDTISAFIKSMRGSDPNAAVYYMAKMIVAGEDPEFIARRMVIFASEDVGNASPQAINITTSTLIAIKNIGMPESEIILSQCATFLASSPKSNSSYLAIKDAKHIAKETDYEIPLHIRNAPTGLMKSMGYAKGYKYPHDYDGHFVVETYLPLEIKKEKFYDPGTEGSEKAILDRLKRLWPDIYK